MEVPGKIKTSLFIAVPLIVAAVAAWYVLSPSATAPNSPAASRPDMIRTPECEAGKPQARPEVLYFSLAAMNKNGSGGVLMPKGSCYQIGYSELQAVGPTLNGIHFWQPVPGGILITGIDSITGQKYPPDLLKILQFEDIPRLQAFYSKLRGLKLESGMYFIRFRILKPGAVSHTREIYPYSNVSSTVDLAGAELAAKNGAMWLDIRSAEEYSRSHHPSAKNLVYQRAKPDELDISAAVKGVTSQDKLNLDLLPKDRSAPVLISGEDEFDFRVYGAITLAHLAGWKNLLWYREGESGRVRRPLSTPILWNGITRVDAREALELKSGGAKIIDTRPANLSRFPENREQAIEGAIRAPFTGDDTVSPFLSLNLSSLQASGQKFATEFLPENRDEAVLLYGEDEFDWSALKAAIWAKDSGWRKVHWLRSGLAGWNSARDVLGDKFSTSELKY